MGACNLATHDPERWIDRDGDLCRTEVQRIARTQLRHVASDF
jgi:hypothetical protein